jgi:hypothetical protein
MGGSLVPEVTPGGGLTMTLRLRAIDAVDATADRALLDRIDGWSVHVPEEPR